MICTLCDSLLTYKKDLYYYHCRCCKAIVKDKRYYLNREDEKARYLEHNNDVDDLGYQNFTSPITNFVLDHFLPEDKGLDFGSGTGPVISSMLMKENYDVVQYDPFFAPDRSVLNVSYDYIINCEVFEHFYNPKEEIDRLVKMLKKGGTLLIMTFLYHDQIAFDNWVYRNDPTHVFIYTKETIEYIAKEKNLEILVLTDRFIALRKFD